MGTNGRVYDNILQCIGNTPMVRLNRIPKDHGLECEIFAKCEFLNPGGSIKDRISYTMVQDAEKSGKAKSGTRFVEPTSGNTGIGVSLTTAVLGYDCTIVTPDKNSDEKMSTMSLLGSEIIQTPSLAHYEDPDSFVSVAKRILEEDPNAISMDQYCNEVNPATHYEHTAEEILAAVSEPDVLVMGAGTGGTVTGIARKFRERCPRCAIVAVDPVGSLLFGDGKYSLFFVEGIGGDFVPRVLDKALIDKVVKPTDHEAFNMSREIIRKEGLLCGGSSGAIVHSAIRAAKELKLGAGKRVVVLLPDGIRNYMTKFVCDQWMEAHLFKEPPRRDAIWWKGCISDLKIKRNVPAIRQNCSCKDALAAMSSENTVVFIVNDDGYFQGVVSKDSLRSEATNPKKGILNFNDNIMKYVMKKYYKIIENKGAPTVGLAARVLDIAPFVIVVEEYRDTNRNYSGYIPKGIINSDIVLDYIIEQQNHV